MQFFQLNILESNAASFQNFGGCLFPRFKQLLMENSKLLRECNSKFIVTISIKPIMGNIIHIIHIHINNTYKYNRYNTYIYK